MSSVSSLMNAPNIGIDTARQLEAAGIMTLDALRETGSKEAWLLLRARDPSACYARLCGLEGAIRGVRWHSLPDDVKRELKSFYNAHKA